MVEKREGPYTSEDYEGALERAAQASKVSKDEVQEYLAKNADKIAAAVDAPYNSADDIPHFSTSERRATLLDEQLVASQQLADEIIANGGQPDLSNDVGGGKGRNTIIIRDIIEEKQGQ